MLSLCRHCQSGGESRIMATISVRQLNDRTMELLKHLAIRNSRSLESEVRSILDHAVRNDKEAKWERFFAAVDKLGLRAKPGDATGAELIRRGRERRLRKF